MPTASGTFVVSADTKWLKADDCSSVHSSLGNGGILIKAFPSHRRRGRLRAPVQLQRQALDLGSEVRRGPLDRAGRREVGKGGEQHGQEQLELESRDVAAQAVMLAEAKGEMWIRVPINIEVIRILEDIGIAIRRAEPRDDPITFRDLSAPDLRVPGRDP